MKFKHDKDASSVTYLGKEHEVDEDGLVELPADAAEDLASHGFKPHDPVSDAQLKAIQRQEREKAAAVLKPLKEKKAAAVLKAVDAADPAFTADQLKTMREAEAAAESPREDVLEGLDERLVKLETPAQ